MLVEKKLRDLTQMCLPIMAIHIKFLAAENETYYQWAFFDLGKSFLTYNF